MPSIRIFDLLRPNLEAQNKGVGTYDKFPESYENTRAGLGLGSQSLDSSFAPIIAFESESLLGESLS